MARRRNIICSSSSDDEDHQPLRPNHNLPPPEQDDHLFADVQEEEQIETLIHHHIPNLDAATLDSSLTSSSAAAVPIVVSDEDFVDVSDELSPPDAFVSSDCPVNDCLRKMGVCLRREWLDSCKLGLQDSVTGFSVFDVESKAKVCFAQALFSDFNYSGAGVLPPNVDAMHLVDLAGPFVLQVDEVVNISCPLKERYKGASAGLKRCLRLSMTDGAQRVFGMEYRPIPNKTLEALAPAGFKVVIRNVNVRHGLLMLAPEVFEVLGGSVEELEATRGRLIHELNKPPRGKRYRETILGVASSHESRTGVVPPLLTRATLAAWPQNGVNNNTVPVNDAHHVPENRTTNSTFHATPTFHGDNQGTDTTSRNLHACPDIREATNVSSRGQTDQRFTSGESAQCSIVREAVQPSTAMETDELPTSRESTEESTRRESTGLSSFSTNVVQNMDANMDVLVDHQLILSGANELPFTYLASLSAKWASVQGTEPFVQGKIKCFMAGVKLFRYKQQSTYELRVYVDDGSLISEILIHHNAVQKWIGYSPEELTACLASPDKNVVNDTRNTLREFQIFLVQFEGTIVMEINETSTVPVALEISNGSPPSDAQLLLRRLKSYSSSQICQNDASNVINLSP